MHRTQSCYPIKHESGIVMKKKSLQLDTNQRISFYECRGKPLIISTAFVNSKPWLLPIDIQSLSSKNILNLEPFLTVYGNLYQLTGYSLNSGNHFTAVIFWYGKKFYYDGMQKKGCCLIPFVEDQLNKYLCGPICTDHIWEEITYALHRSA